RHKLGSPHECTNLLWPDLAWAGFLGTLTLISLVTSLLLLAGTSDIWDLGTALAHFGILAAIADKFGEQTINAVMVSVWGLLCMLLLRSPSFSLSPLGGTLSDRSQYHYLLVSSGTLIAIFVITYALIFIYPYVIVLRLKQFDMGFF